MSLDQQPAIRRIVTGHREDGKAVHLEDKSWPIVPVVGGRVGFKVLYETERVPTQNNDFVDPMLSVTNDLANAAGSIFRCVDFLPISQGGTTLMHRTSSVDYAIVIDGEITHCVDSGDETIMREGDVLIQRGTMHGWKNHSDSVCRMYFILLAAEPAKVGGDVLQPGGYDPSDMATGGKTEHASH